MQWIQHPAFQSGIAPFALATVMVIALLRYRPLSESLVIVCSVLLTVALITDISFLPLTATRKIILLSIVVAAAALAMHYGRMAPATQRLITIVLGIGAGLWVVWPFLTRQPWLDTALIVFGLSAYISILLLLLPRLATTRTKRFSLAFNLGIFTSLNCIVGASLLFGQLAMAFAMVAAVLLLLFLARPVDIDSGEVFTLSYVLPVALLGIAAAVYAKLPWQALALLATIPFTGLIKIPQRRPEWQLAGIYTLLSAIPGIVGLIITWQIAGPVPL